LRGVYKQNSVIRLKSYTSPPQIFDLATPLHYNTVKQHLEIAAISPSPVAAGGFGGLNPPKQSTKPPNRNMKHYKSVEILSNYQYPKSKYETLQISGDFVKLSISSPLAQNLKTPHKRKAPLLKTS